jgi:hypothetical protein
MAPKSWRYLAIERMLEEHLYFLSVYERWLVNEILKSARASFSIWPRLPSAPFLA